MSWRDLDPGRVSRERQLLLNLVDFLEEEEIQQFAEYEGLCPHCHSPYYGILDESKVKLPLAEGFRSALFGRQHAATRHVGGRTYMTTVASFSNYEIRQDIVRSGLFTRRQLSSYQFSQHELEVNERSFYDIRPKRCDCNFGSEPELSEYELAILASLEAMDNYDRPTAVESSFIGGEPVRTGFRRRSAEARRRRRRRGEKVTCVTHHRVVVKPRVHPTCVGHPLGVITPSTVELEFHYIPRAVRPGGKRREKFLLPRKYRPPRGYSKPDCIPDFLPPTGEYSREKYYYFHRKRGFWFPSLHHPTR